MNYKISKGKKINVSCTKDIIDNYINVFDTNLNTRKRFKDGYEEVTRLKRNLK